MVPETASVELRPGTGASDSAAADLFGGALAEPAGPEGITEWGAAALRLEVSDRQIRNWRQRPDWKWQLPLSDVALEEIRQWRRGLQNSGSPARDAEKEHAATLAEQRQVNIALARLKLQRERGELVDRQQVIDEWRSAVLRIRTDLERLAEALGAELQLEPAEREVIRRHVEQLCARYARGQVSEARDGVAAP